MKISFILIFIALLNYACHIEGGNTKKQRSSIVGSIIPVDVMDEEQLNLATSTCEALASKRNNFSLNHLDKNFYFNLYEDNCDGTKTVDVKTNAHQTISVEMILRERHIGDLEFERIDNPDLVYTVETDMAPLMDRICQNVRGAETRPKNSIEDVSKLAIKQFKFSKRFNHLIEVEVIQAVRESTRAPYSKVTSKTKMMIENSSTRSMRGLVQSMQVESLCPSFSELNVGISKRDFVRIETR